MSSHKVYLLSLVAVGLMLCYAPAAHAGQGCPFEDGSCQEYCNQQGCNLGYCGHFAWIQCICRKCGDEWNWYDKVHYNPNQQVNQTELDSLKLNGSAPVIMLTDRKSPETIKVGAEGVVQVPRQEEEQKKVSVLTTLLIPDLSDSSRLDLNDIPDENSEKFLDYLAKNHEKLVQATSSDRAGKQLASTSSDVITLGADDADDEESEDQQQANTATTTMPESDEIIEIEISSQSNGSGKVAPTTTSTSSTTTTTTTSSIANEGAGPVTRLLRMAVAERLSEELN